MQSIQPLGTLWTWVSIRIALRVSRAIKYKSFLRATLNQNTTVNKITR